MPRIFRFLSRLFVWIARFPHRKGYGIHSPFAFNLVTGVIYEEGTFYAYETLSKERKHRGGEEEKDDRLMFRLINDHQPRTCLVATARGCEALRYLEAGCPSCRFVSAEDDDWTTCGDIDMVYADSADRLAPLVEAVMKRGGAQLMFAVRGIRNDDSALAAWKQLAGREEVRVTFDLYRIGLAYCEARLNRQAYIINYF